MSGSQPPPEFFVRKSIDSQDDKIALLSCSEASNGWLLSFSPSTVVSKTYLGQPTVMASSPTPQRPLVRKYKSRPALKDCRSTSKELQERLSLPTELSSSGVIEDPFSSCSDSDCSSEDYSSYNASCDELFDSYFEGPNGSLSSRTPSCEGEAPEDSPIHAQDSGLSSSNLVSPIRRSGATRVPRRATQATYSPFPPPIIAPSIHSYNNSWPLRGDSYSRPRANTTPSNYSLPRSSAASSRPMHTFSAPVSPTTATMVERSAFDHDDDDDDDDEVSAWRKAFGIRAGGTGEKERDDSGKRSWRLRGGRVLKDVFKIKKAPPN